jgi:phage tail-like protein
LSEARFFSLRAMPAWRRGARMHLTADDEGLTIVRRDVYRPARRDEADHPRLVRPVADAAADASGRWFLLDGAAGVWKADMVSGHTESLLPSGHGWFTRAASIAVLSDMWAAADPDASPTLALLSSDNAQVLWAKSDWNGETFRSLAVAADGKDRTVVLAAFESADDGLVLRLLRFEASGDPAGALDVTLPDPPAAEEDGSDALATAFRSRRFALSLADRGAGWLLDRDAATAMPFDFDGAEGTASFLPLPPEATPALAICAAPDGSAWIVRGAEAGGGRALLRLGRDGRAEGIGEGGQGGADRLQSGPGDRLYVWDNDEATVTTLRAKPETAIWEPFRRRMGVWLGGSLDSTTTETEWHKLVVDAVGEPDTQVRIRYYASDRKAVVAGGQLIPDLDRYIADASIEPDVKLTTLRDVWSEPIVDPKDALLFGARGRYLWLYIELIGSEANAPTVRGVQAHFPRHTYVNDLPALYQQDAKSKDFLDRFLSMFQTMMEETDAHIAGVPRTFDPEASSGRSLRWLLSWLGLREDDHWTDEQLRKLLKAAPRIYKLRGTRLALETLIEIYTGERPIIMEYDQLRTLKEHAELGDVAEKLYATDSHGFNVLVKPEHADSETKRVTLQHLIDSCKPAFATAKLIVLQPWVYMDLHSYLGLNTVLSEPTLLTLDGRSSMPHHTITIDVGQDNRVDQHTRLELDSRLE